jgi:hypothetical protein
MIIMGLGPAEMHGAQPADDRQLKKNQGGHP